MASSGALSGRRPDARAPPDDAALLLQQARACRLHTALTEARPASRVPPTSRRLTALPLAPARGVLTAQAILAAYEAGSLVPGELLRRARAGRERG